MQILKAGTVYFLLVFAAGFALGVVRELWLVPRFGGRTAELLEFPLMLLVTILAARWTVRHFALPAAGTRKRLGIGGIALGLLLGTELTVVLWLRGLSLPDYIASRDPLTGGIYLGLLVFFALMPLLVGRK